MRLDHLAGRAEHKDGGATKLTGNKSEPRLENHLQILLLNLNERNYYANDYVYY